MRPLQFSGAITVHSARIANQSYSVSKDCPMKEQAAEEARINRQREAARDQIVLTILDKLAQVPGVSASSHKGEFIWRDDSGQEHCGFVGIAPNNESVTIASGPEKQVIDQTFLVAVVEPALYQRTHYAQDVEYHSEGPAGAFQVIKGDGKFKLAGIITEFDPQAEEATLQLFNDPNEPGRPLTPEVDTIRYNPFSGIPHMVGRPTPPVVRQIVNGIQEKLPKRQMYANAAE